MRILVIGGGAREDALSWRLARSASCSEVVHAPGNAGTAVRGENLSDVGVTDARKIVDRARAHKIELAVLGPETAIAAGVGDRLRDAGIAVFGPGRSAGRLETSKIYAKRFMERHAIPTARFRVVHSYEQAQRALEDWSGGVVIKADGIAAGKGVVVSDDVESAKLVLHSWFARGVPGGGVDVVLEQRLSGREVSVFAVGDGRAMIELGAACDYKRAGDGDAGPNTGGMGAYSPPAGFPSDFAQTIREKIVGPTFRGLLADGVEYRGVLYFGVMWTAKGPFAIEYNARFGDPETQVLLPCLSGDFARYLRSAADGAIEIDAIAPLSGACVGVSLVTKAYPYENTPLRGLPGRFDLPPDTEVFWGASQRNGNDVASSGGRVLTLSARGADLGAARTNVYAAIDRLKTQFPAGTSLRYRSDIAHVSQLPAG